jgi:hypothetical protein
MFELKENIQRLKAFYNQEQIEFVFDSILEGNTPSEVYVDNVETPSISLIWDKGHCFYFGGIAADEAAYSKGIEFFADKFLNETSKQIIKVAKVYFASDV